MSKPEIIGYLPLIITFLTAYFALHQIRSNNITNARIKWLEDLKQVITDFFSECNVLILSEGVATLNPTTKSKEQDIEGLQTSIASNLKNIYSKHDLIILNLNPKEELHIKFEKLLDSYISLLNKTPLSKLKTDDYIELVRQIDKHSEGLLTLIRYIMKIEWEKTKRSSFSYRYYINLGKGKKLMKEAINLSIQSEAASTTL